MQDFPKITDARAVIEAREPQINAWTALDWAAVDAQLDAIRAIPVAQRGPLWGVPVGVKDVLQTRDFPTEFGTPIFRGHRPVRGAACLTQLAAAGGVVQGKTVTTELAFMHPGGKTRNPHDLSRTPGGSSSGSAAAVAAGMVPMAIGTQTAGSVLRPAAFCGIVGFKPTHGAISTSGVLLTSSTLDTVGTFARTVNEAGLLAAVLAGRKDWGTSRLVGAPRIALFGGGEADAATDEANRAVEAAVDGLIVGKANRAGPFADLMGLQWRIMAFELSRNLADLIAEHPDQLSAKIHDMARDAAAITPAQYDADLRTLGTCRASFDQLFGDADILALPSAVGEAPLADEGGTGDPALNRAATLLGVPAITVPVGNGPTGLPLGLQLLARPGEEANLLAAASFIEKKLA